MSNGPEEIPARLVFRVFTDEEGKVYLSLDRVEGKGAEASRQRVVDARGKQVEVQRPVSRETLDQAATSLVLQILEERGEKEAELAVREGGDDKRVTAQQQARKKVEAALYPKGRLFIAVPIIIFVWILFVSVARMGVLYSREHLPEFLHLAVLALYALGLILAVSLIATDRRRRKHSNLLGPVGLLVLPGSILVLAASVFASLTFTLHGHGLVNFELCRETPVSEQVLLDFYLWHFLQLVPLLHINDVLKWKEPLCYSQSRIGILILLFQAFVVLPSIATLRYFWTNRSKLSEGTREYVYEPDWLPKSKEQ